MKDKILFLIIGILVGAIITASIFLVLGKNRNTGMPNEGEAPSFEDMKNRGERPDFENMGDGERTELPEDMDESELENGRGSKGQKGTKTEKNTTEKDTTENSDANTENTTAES